MISFLSKRNVWYFLNSLYLMVIKFYKKLTKKNFKVQVTSVKKIKIHFEQTKLQPKVLAFFNIIYKLYQKNIVLKSFLKKKNYIINIIVLSGVG